jgi:hypothetical protein
MLAHPLPLLNIEGSRLVQDGIGYPDLPDVVESGCYRNLRKVDPAMTATTVKMGNPLGCQAPHPMGVLGCFTAFEMEDGQKGFRQTGGTGLAYARFAGIDLNSVCFSHLPSGDGPEPCFCIHATLPPLFLKGKKTEIAVSRKKNTPARILPESCRGGGAFLDGFAISTEIFSPATNPSMDSTTTTHFQDTRVRKAVN